MHKEIDGDILKVLNKIIGSSYEDLPENFRKLV